MILRRDIFQALADPTRRAILVLLASQALTAGSIAQQFNAARSTVSKHIKILTECGLVQSDQQGREIYYRIQMDKIKEADLWLEELRSLWEARFESLDTYITKLQKE